MSFNKELQILLEKLREPSKDLDRFDSPPSPVVQAKERPTAPRARVKEGNFFQRAASAIGLTPGTRYVKPQAPDKAIRGDKAMNILTTAQAGLQAQVDRRNAEQAQMDAIGVKKQAIKDLAGSLTPPPTGKEPTAPGKLSPNGFAPHAGNPNMDSKKKDPNAAETRNDKIGNNLNPAHISRTRTGAGAGAEGVPSNKTVLNSVVSTKMPGANTGNQEPVKANNRSNTPPHPGGDGNLSQNRNDKFNIPEPPPNSSASKGSPIRPADDVTQDSNKVQSAPRGQLNALKNNYADTRTFGEQPKSNAQGIEQRPTPEQIQQQKEANVQKAATAIKGTLAAVSASANKAVTKGGQLLQSKTPDTAAKTTKAEPPPDKGEFSNDLNNTLKQHGVKKEQPKSGPEPEPAKPEKKAGSKTSKKKEK